MSKLEQYLWGTQVREANNLEGETPILNNIAAAKGISVAEVAEGVLSGHTKFNQKVAALYKEMLDLKQKFKEASTIKDLNVLWRDYMGIPLPILNKLKKVKFLKMNILQLILILDCNFN